MRLEHLKVFCDVVRLRSFSRGAEEAHLSQSAASQIVAGLEEELGLTLIDRSHRPLEPTVEGLAYYHGCSEILRAHQGLLDSIRGGTIHGAGTVHIASIYSAGLHTLSDYVDRFRERHPEIRVEVEYRHPSGVTTAVIDGKADLGVVSYPRPHRDLVVLPWLDEEMVLACPPSHRLAQQETVALAALDGERFVSFDKDLVIRKEIDRALRKHHVTVVVVSEFDNIETIKNALEIENAVTILPRASIAREVERRTVCEVRITETPLRRPVGVIHRRRHRLSPAADAFVNSLLDEPL